MRLRSALVCTRRSVPFSNQNRSSRLMLLCQRERLVSGDLVLPGGLIGVHGSVDHIDKVAFEDASGATGTFGGLLAGDEFLRGRAEAFLHDGGRIENAVEAAVASPVKAVTFVVGGIDRDWSAAGVAGQFGRTRKPCDVTDFGE
jgi:hypothetical protein